MQPWAWQPSVFCPMRVFSQQARPGQTWWFMGKIFTSEGNLLVEAFAVKGGKYVYAGDKAGAETFIKKGRTQVVDYTGKGLVMPGG